MNNSFQIFEPGNKLFTPTKSNILFIVMVTFIFILSWVKHPHPFIKIAGVVLIVIWVFNRITASFRYKTLNGKYTGAITFNETSLLINDRKIEVSKIKNIYLRAGDYEGRERSSRTNIRSMSNGTNNLLELTLTSGEVIKLFFKIGFMQHESLQPFVIALVKNNLMTLEKALDILKIDDDYQIEKFKNELNKKEPE